MRARWRAIESRASPIVALLLQALVLAGPLELVRKSTAYLTTENAPKFPSVRFES